MKSAHPQRWPLKSVHPFPTSCMRGWCCHSNKSVRRRDWLNGKPRLLDVSLHAPGVWLIKFKSNQSTMIRICNGEETRLLWMTRGCPDELKKKSLSKKWKQNTIKIRSSICICFFHFFSVVFICWHFDVWGLTTTGQANREPQGKAMWWHSNRTTDAPRALMDVRRTYPMCSP